MYHWVEYKNFTGTLETTWQCHIKLSIYIPHDLAISLLGIYSKETKTHQSLYIIVNSHFIKTKTWKLWLWIEYLCPPWFHTLKSKSQWYGVWKWAFGKWSDHECRTLMNWNSAITKRLQRALPSPNPWSWHVRTQWLEGRQLELSNIPRLILSSILLVLLNWTAFILNLNRSRLNYHKCSLIWLQYNCFASLMPLNLLFVNYTDGFLCKWQVQQLLPLHFFRQPFTSLCLTTI